MKPVCKISLPHTNKTKTNKLTSLTSLDDPTSKFETLAFFLAPFPLADSKSFPFLFLLPNTQDFPFLSLTFHTFFFLNTNLSNFHTWQLVSITVTSLLEYPFSSLSPPTPKPFSSSTSSSSSSSSSTPQSTLLEFLSEFNDPVAERTFRSFRTQSKESFPLLFPEMKQNLGFVCFLGTFSFFLENLELSSTGSLTPPMLKRSERTLFIIKNKSLLSLEEISLVVAVAVVAITLIWSESEWVDSEFELITEFEALVVGELDGFGTEGSLSLLLLKPLLDQSRSNQFELDLLVWTEHNIDWLAWFNGIWGDSRSVIILKGMRERWELFETELRSVWWVVLMAVAATDGKKEFL